MDSGNATFSVPAWNTTNISYTYATGTTMWLASWIGYTAIGSEVYYFDTGELNREARVLDTNFESWPSTFGTATHVGRIDSMYATYTESPGSVQRSIEFGQDAYFSISDAAQSGLDPGSVVTVEAWINLESIPSNQTKYHFVSKSREGTGPDRSYLFGIIGTGSGNTNMHAEMNSSSNTANVAQNFSTDTWYHVAWVMSGSGGSGSTMYVNGTSVGTDNGVGGINDNTQSFLIGGRNLSGSVSNQLGGLIDEVRVWNTVRTQQQIQDNMNIELTGSESGLQGYWQFNGNILDETSNNNDLSSNGTFSYSTDSPFASGEPPSAPSALLTEGSTNPTAISDPTPEFSALYNDPNDSDNAVFYQLQVATSSSYWGSPYWDSTQTAMATTSVGSRSPDISYSGSALASSTPYYWRIKFWDDDGNEGAWSTTTASFILAGSMPGNGIPNTSPSHGGIQNMRFTYDAVGNITQVSETSGSGLGRVVVYGYDDLYRLTSASTTAASSTPFTQTYTYSKLGNITNKSDVGVYTYAETGYANPHAPTTINGVTHAYDNNGNLTAVVGSKTNQWDYRNRLVSAYASSSASTFFTYDHTIQRTTKGTGTATTTYPNRYYTVTSATTTKSIFAGDELLATITGTGGNASTTYNHNDWLGGTSAVTNSAGTVVQALDYYPYGSERISSGSNSTDRHYIGERFDSETSMNYLNSRYLQNSRGQFISEDPVFWEQKQNLTNPQSLNSYSYANDNPILNKDPSGRCGLLTPVCLAVLDGLEIYFTSMGVAKTFEAGYSNYYSDKPATEKFWNTVTHGILNLGSKGARTSIEDVGIDSTLLGGEYFPFRQFQLNQNYNNPIQRLTSNYSGPAFGVVGGNLVIKTSSNSAPMVYDSSGNPAKVGNSGSGGFIGTYDFGPGIGKYDYGKKEWVPPPPPPSQSSDSKK
ncbi:hypothetical protein A2841_00385 [Candidatus Kaiserbacteria bacterium RIFCSPHIGHO2_01_FULL_48_10]|uniref:LamG-like jellyroll fold domain-containing protein n=1 Tax=Candidatus Kaiserbacteria bacterium RIFCSPHIGHO2_01_FULL_48_10 TaxID=1798476 RepID=A0A1F6C4L8_9BACT|nr:MAG: hypothetical protein A2841_00385 [Candidatus Kaiserbacteria bacterium RIFCSPHIGHO2_01_FULL_48_10]